MLHTEENFSHIFIRPVSSSPSLSLSPSTLPLQLSVVTPWGWRMAPSQILTSLPPAPGQTPQRPNMEGGKCVSVCLLYLEFKGYSQIPKHISTNTNFFLKSVVILPLMLQSQQKWSLWLLVTLKMAAVCWESNKTAIRWTQCAAEGDQICCNLQRQKFTIPV